VALKTVLVMVTVVLQTGLVMDIVMVLLKHMVMIFHAMTVMVVTVLMNVEFVKVTDHPVLIHVRKKVHVTVPEPQVVMLLKIV